MSTPVMQEGERVEDYLTRYERNELLRFLTCGSVDDGKSTLIGRLLHDSKSIFEDQMESVERSSVQMGAEYTNLALLTDGLRAEREQGITIAAVHHDINVAAACSDRIYAIKDGTIVFDGTPQEVIDPGTLNRIYDTDFTLIPSPDRDLPMISAGGVQ